MDDMTVARAAKEDSNIAQLFGGPPFEPLEMRAFGQNLTMSRVSWYELRDELQPGELRDRIGQLLGIEA